MLHSGKNYWYRSSTSLYLYEFSIFQLTLYRMSQYVRYSNEVKWRCFLKSKISEIVTELQLMKSRCENLWTTHISLLTYFYNSHVFHTTKRGSVFEFTCVFNVQNKLYFTFNGNLFFLQFFIYYFSHFICAFIFVFVSFSTRLPAELIRHGGSLFVPLVWWLRGGQDVCSDRLPAVPESDVHIGSEVLHCLAGLVCIGMTYFYLFFSVCVMFVAVMVVVLLLQSAVVCITSDVYLLLLFVALNLWFRDCLWQLDSMKAVLSAFGVFVAMQSGHLPLSHEIYLTFVLIFILSRILCTYFKYIHILNH